MQKNTTLIIIAAIVVAVLVASAFLIASRLGNSSKLSESLDLGNQYLTEQNYEEAVAAFLVAIDIDPKCAEAYIGAADAYIGLGDYDSALSNFHTRYE